MKISETTYYLNMTAFLRSGAAGKRTVFSEAGLTYTSDRIAIAMERRAKNGYEVLIVHGGHKKKHTCGSLKDAIAVIRDLVEHDLKAA
jgi:putative intracellular protease/amidase